MKEFSRSFSIKVKVCILFLGMPFVCQVCTQFLTMNFHRCCGYWTLNHPGSEILCNVNSCKRKYVVARSYIRHLKKHHFWFYEKHWCSSSSINPSSDTPIITDNILLDLSSNTLDSCALLNSSGSVVQSVSDIDYHDCEENLPAVEKTIDYDTLVATFLLELREIKKASGVAF